MVHPTNATNLTLVCETCSSLHVSSLPSHGTLSLLANPTPLTVGASITTLVVYTPNSGRVAGDIDEWEYSIGGVISTVQVGFIVFILQF